MTLDFKLCVRNNIDINIQQRIRRRISIVTDLDFDFDSSKSFQAVLYLRSFRIRNWNSETSQNENQIQIPESQSHQTLSQQIYYQISAPIINMSVYSMAGGTLSEKNVAEEYLLSSSQLIKGSEDGKLNVQWRSCHGNSYRLYVRSEVAEYVKVVGPDVHLKAAYDAKMVKQNLVTNRARLAAVSNELSCIDARKLALINEKRTLEEWLQTNDPKEAAKAAKEAKGSAAKKRKLTADN